MKSPQENRTTKENLPVCPNFNKYSKRENLGVFKVCRSKKPRGFTSVSSFEDQRNTKQGSIFSNKKKDEDAVPPPDHHLAL